MWKTIKITASAILIAVVFQTIRTLWAAGAFKTIHPHSEEEMSLLPGMTGAEDITIDPTTGQALISSFDRRNRLAGKTKKGAIYALDFQANPPVFKDLTRDFDQADFGPHGISLYEDPVDSTRWLFVVNHRMEGHFIEIFQRTDSSLVHRETISSELFLSPNDVVGVGKREFYFTNDHGSRGGISQLKDFLMIGTGQVGYFDGNTVKTLDKGLLYANGINLSKDGQYVLVACTTGRSINVYQRQPFELASTIDCGTGVDNIELDEAGNLWVGAHPKLLAFLNHAKDGSKKSPSQVLKIVFQGPDSPSVVKEIYLNDGAPLSGSSVAAVFQNHLLVGTVFEDGVLAGKMEGLEE